MNDITPKEAIANLNHLYGVVSPDIQRSLDVAIKDLERPTGDCISRVALRKTICDMDFDFGDYYDHTDEIIDRICEKIDNAPPAGVQQGKWVEKTFDNDDEEGTKSKSFVCGCCGAPRLAGMGNAKFCYNCGADMRP